MPSAVQVGAILIEEWPMTQLLGLESEQPPLPYPGATPDAERAQQPALPEPPYKPYAKKPALPEPPYEPYKGM